MKALNTKLALTIAVATMMIIVPLINACAGNADEDKEVKAPKAVLVAFHKSYPSAKILNVFIETKDKIDYYEIESLDNSTTRDLLYFPDGTIFEIEEPIAISSLPKKVLDRVNARFPKGTIKVAEKIMNQAGIVEYGVILVDGEKGIELLLNTKGVIKLQTSVSDDEISEINDTEDAGETGQAEEDGEED